MANLGIHFNHRKENLMAWLGCVVAICLSLLLVATTILVFKLYQIIPPLELAFIVGSTTLEDITLILPSVIYITFTRNLFKRCVGLNKLLKLEFWPVHLIYFFFDSGVIGYHLLTETGFRMTTS